MYLEMTKRLMAETDKRLLAKLVWNFALKGALSVQRFKTRIKRGEYFPPFLYVSVLNSCNLRCQGCWVDVAAKQERIRPDRMNKMIREAVDAGNQFFGILGGEPFMHRELLDILEAHPDCYFQVFTNGQLITDSIAKRLRKMGNVTPLISVEGTDIVSDQRRGGKDVLNKTLQGIENCVNNKLLTGVATSLCRTNYEDLLREEWVDRLIEMGVMYMWYHTYRPVGPQPNEALALTPEQQRQVREFVVNTRATKPIAVIDAYYDHNGQALCPAATGISHHISPWGAIEPCPIIQFAKEKIDDDRGLKRAFLESKYLSDFREMVGETTRGCVVLERPDLLKEVIETHKAEDGTARKTAMPELEAMEPRSSQFMPEAEIAEKSLPYKLAKKWFFNDFGSYQKLDAERAKETSLKG